MAETKTIEKVVGVNGNMLTVEFTDRVMQNEVPRPPTQPTPPA